MDVQMPSLQHCFQLLPGERLGQIIVHSRRGTALAVPTPYDRSSFLMSSAIVSGVRPCAPAKSRSCPSVSKMKIAEVWSTEYMPLSPARRFAL
jgi:hypothetical protein